jgi:hypothetical protein
MGGGGGGTRAVVASDRAGGQRRCFHGSDASLPICMLGRPA